MVLKIAKLIRPLVVKRQSSHKPLMSMIPSNWEFKKALDIFHFYVCLTGLPLLFTYIYVRFFIGDATLADIPEGYIPKDYEYYKNPWYRFTTWMFGHNFKRVFAGFLVASHREEFDDSRWAWASKLVKELEFKNRDSRNMWYIPYDDRYSEYNTQVDRVWEDVQGDDYARFFERELD